MRVIVTTTINRPTKALLAFSAMKEWELVVVGDLKTPTDFHLERGTYLSPSFQERYDRQLSDAIGWNCIQRRNFGLLLAYDMGADVVALVDDDNIPLPRWGQKLMLGEPVEAKYWETTLAAFDPIGVTNYPHLWHRGYPLQLLSQRTACTLGRRAVTCSVQADFWNGDPDIDAICRMEHGPQCDFDPALFPIASNQIAPFNSQNTFLSSVVLPDYFLFPHVGRMDDIWASYYVQSKGHRVIFGAPSVFQERNPHDLIRDLQQEYLGYENNLKLVKSLRQDPDSIRSFLPGRSAWAFELYRRHFR